MKAVHSYEEKSFFGEFVRELLKRKNLSFRKTAQIARDLGFEVSASSIYKAIHNSKRNLLKSEYINMFATIFNMDRSELEKKILDDKYCDYFFEDVKDHNEVCKKALDCVKEGNFEEGKYLIEKYVQFLKEYKKEKDWKDIGFDLNMRFIFSLRDMGKYSWALDQCRSFLNSGEYSINDSNSENLLKTLDILHMMTCLLYRLNRKSEFDLYYHTGIWLAEEKLKDLFQKLRFEAVKANFLYENKLYEKAISCNQEIVNALKKNADVFKKEDTELYQKYLCNLSSALTNLGWVLVETAKSKEKVNKGIEKIQEGYEMVQKTGRKKLLAHVLFYLARAFFKLGDYDKAREFFMKSKGIAEKELFLDLIAFNHWGLALTYEAKGDKRSSEQYLMLAKSEIKKVEEDTLEKKEVEEYLESKAKGI